MRFAPWQQLPLELEIQQIPNTAVLFHDGVDAWVFAVRPGEADSKSQRKTRAQSLAGKRIDKDRAQTDTLHRVAHSLMGKSDDVRAMALPAVMWQEESIFAPRNLVAAFLSAVVLALMLMVLGPGQFYGAWMISTLPALAVRHWWPGHHGVDFLAPKELGITMDTVLPYALTREQGQLWVPPTAGADRRDLIRRRVDAIRQAYSAAREDIVARIEKPALFDPAVATTAEFEAALVAFADADMDHDVDRLDELASEVEVTFNVAEAAAERLGLDHYPDHARDDARRAAKAARLAQGASTDGERATALHQVQRILDSLALYYLPKDAASPKAIAGPAPSETAEEQYR